MCFGGGDEDDLYPGKVITNVSRSDPLTEARQTMLWDESKRFAETSPYTSQYGGASAIPGMSGMSQAGQEYLTNSILGSGNYQDPAQNLGFSDYSRPDSANQDNTWNFTDAAPVVPDQTLSYNDWRRREDAGGQQQAQQRSATPQEQQQMQQPEQQYQQQARQSITPQMESQYATLQAQMAKGAEQQRANPMIGQSLRSPEEQALLQTFREARPPPQLKPESQFTQPEVARGDSKTVGIGEMELAADATQRLLGQEGPQYPSWERITDPTIGVTTVGNVADIRNTTNNIAGPAGVTINPFTGQVAEALENAGPGTIAGPGELALDPVTGQATQAVARVTPGEFGGSSFLGGPAISDYMNTAGTDAAVTQAREDYEIALNREKARQAQVGAFGSRGTVEEAGLIAAQERNIAQIRGAGFDRAAQMMESDAGRRQQAGLQSQQLGFQGGMAGQALEAQRRESDAARAQQAALQGQQLGFQGQLQTQQLAQSGNIRGAELGLQASMQGQQLEAQRRSEEAARYQQAGLAGQQLQAQSGMQAQQLGTQVAMQNAQNEIRVAEQNMQSALQTGNQQAAIDAQRQIAQSQMRLDAATRNQQAGLQSAVMGMDAQEQFRQQQLAAAQQLANIGYQTQDATFAAGNQLQQMGAQQERAQLLQQAWDYEQWLRGQQGGAESLAMMRSMLPGGSQETLGRGPDKWGQMLGAVTSLAGATGSE